MKDRRQYKARRRYKPQEASFADRLVGEAKRCREQASRLPPGHEREARLQKARQADTAAQINDWVNSPGLQPPK